MLVLLYQYTIHQKEKLLRCFNSICKINSFSYEIIIIDDGSQEKTALICKEFAKLNPGFRYLWKENSGVSQSRNMGIKEAMADIFIL